MARQPLPSAPSRRLRKGRSAAVKVFAAAVLGCCVLLALAGLATALYLQSSPVASLALATPARTVAELPLPPPPLARGMGEPAPPQAAIPSVPSPGPSDLAGTPARPAAPPSADITAGATLPPPVTRSARPLAAAVEPPVSAPDTSAASDAPAVPLSRTTREAIATPAASRPQYWVEYAVFVGRHYAIKLQQNLARAGLDTVVVRTHAPGGRPLLRVRSAQPSDHATAERSAETARRSFSLVALLHRLPAAPVAAVAAAPSRPLYWVRIGAFRERRDAAAARQRLAQRGIDTILYSTRRSGDKALFYLRSRGSPDRSAVANLAARSRPVVTGEAAVWESWARPRPGPRHANSPSAPGGPPLRPTG